VSTLDPEVSRRRNWFGSSVFWLDDWLRKWQHVYEYSDHPACIFRIQRAAAEVDVKLAGGVSVKRGDPILNLHLWNEHLPASGPGRMDFTWARLIGGEIAASLTRLADYMAQDRSYDDIVALRAEMRFAGAEHNMRIVRLSTRYGFESVSKPDSEKVGAVRELGENAMVLLLILAANPGAAHFSALKNDAALIYMSRATLDRCYRSRGAPTDAAPREPGGNPIAGRPRLEIDRSDDGTATGIRPSPS
jgi:hypothetical protein